ncbi:MAG: hypothetical protein EPN84_00100 [Legionella sp.]|nr:MAG: hypothetical protein EPN84_00100 [Legionella sp.]
MVEDDRAPEAFTLPGTLQADYDWRKVSKTTFELVHIPCKNTWTLYINGEPGEMNGVMNEHDCPTEIVPPVNFPDSLTQTRRF